MIYLLKGEASEECPPRNTKHTHEIGNYDCTVVARLPRPRAAPSVYGFGYFTVRMAVHMVHTTLVTAPRASYLLAQKHLGASRLGFGESRVELLVGNASEAVVDGAGESRVESGAGAPQAVRGCVLEFDADAAARGISDGLLYLLVEAVVPQAARGGGGGGTRGGGG
jgi:hypothetical protein